MIQLFKKIEILENELEDLKNNSVIIDYRLFLQINNEISLYIICDDDNIFQDYLSDDNINLDIVGTQEVESDRFYRNLFADDNEKIDVKTTKRNFTNILGNNNLDNYNPPCPLVTFYGYKGGMGCSSTLAVAASYLALRKNKKVVILDCDFESPGFANFFLEEPFSNEHKNGFVEYIFDNEFSENKPNLDNYLRKVSDNYSGKGEIYIMPAGNLDDEIQTGKLFDTHRKHYLEGLARIDFASTEHTVDIFHNLIEDIYEEIKPDVILIDSKSGFNDILGITALKTSNLIVGFFSNNIQNLPGLHFFIDLLHNTDKEDFNGIIMNSFSYRKAFNKFETQIESYINKITDSEEEVKNTKTIEIKKFFFGRHSVLEKIGTFDEDKEDFIDFINYSIEKGFIDLNEEICKQIENTKIIKIKKVIEIPRKKIVDDNIYNFNEKNNDKLSVKVVGRIELGRRNGGIPEERKLKKEILKNLKDANIGDNLYAGRVIDFDKELATQKYFFRECMTELFSLNKKLIIGSKGTGKTYTYLSLKNDDIVNELKRKAGKTNYEYVFFHMVDHKNDLFINTDGFDNYDIENQEAFYEKFWLLYNWNAIMKIAEEKELGYKSTINILYSKNNIETLKEYFDIINDDNKITEIEKDLEDFDNYLKTTLNKYIILLYDDLDELVNPNKWYLKTVHLFNFWEKNKYDKMFPKFFVRKNLLENISGIDNIVKLESRAINLEWQKKEIFTYFFKFIMSDSREYFFKLMRLYNDYSDNIVNIIMEETKFDNQIVSERYLRILSSVFFGEHTGNPKHGESYDWLYRNLSNADKTISIRPFIDLIDESVEYSIKEDYSIKPILPPFYYTHRQARAKAAERYFDDLTSEKGNSDLKSIFDFILANPKFQFSEFDDLQFDNLLDSIILEYPDLENKGKEDLIKLMVANGVIKAVPYRWGEKKYTFAYLYKYKLGLKNRRKEYYND